MRDEAEILVRITELESRVSNIKERMAEEFRKQHTEWNDDLMRFYDRERCVWEYALQQMKWILKQE